MVHPHTVKIKECSKKEKAKNWLFLMQQAVSYEHLGRTFDSDLDSYEFIKELLT